MGVLGKSSLAKCSCPFLAHNLYILEFDDDYVQSDKDSLCAADKWVDIIFDLFCIWVFGAYAFTLILRRLIAWSL